MADCKHAGLFEAHQHCIADTDRLGRLASYLPDDTPTHEYWTRSLECHPTDRCPSTLLCVGTTAKKRALASLFPHYAAGERASVADVFVDPPTSKRKYPLFYVDADLGADPYSTAEISYCHEIRSCKISWHAKNTSHFQHLILSRLLFPVVDVVCIFADDCYGFFGVQDLLTKWEDCGMATILPAGVRPRLIVIASAGLEEDVLQLQRDTIAALAATPQTKDVFSAVRLLAANSDLMYHIEEELAFSRLAKMTTSLLFSAQHLAWIFRQAMHHFSQSIDKPFSHYQCFLDQEGMKQCSHHLETMLNLVACLDVAISQDDIHAYIATTLITIMYPPGAHAFAPAALFDNTVRGLLQGLLNCALGSIHPISIDGIRECVVEIAGQRGRGTSSQDLHKENLRSMAGHLPWEKLYSNKTCFACLQRAPQHVLPCKHSLCDVCVTVMGQACKSQEYAYDLRRCPMCLLPASTTVMLKPPTAGMRLLSVDGGGVRGIVPLRFLNIVEDKLGSKLQQYFDIAFGTSSGGLVTLGLFAMKWTIRDCVTKFECLARDIFKKRDTTGLYGRVKSGLSVLMNDAMYDVAHLETILQGQFGKFNKLFGTAVDGCSKHKFAVTATNITDSSAFVLSNYNSAAHAVKRSGYEHVRPDGPETEPKLWEAARATTAACSLFPVITLPVGTFQDGGTREHNNPTLLATWEARQIWPAGTVFDVVLSLGTGSAVADTFKAPAKRNTLKDGFLLRFIRSSLSGIDGEVQSRHASNTVNTFNADMSAGWFRLNINSGARLDDSSALTDLKRSVDAASIIYEPQIMNLCWTLIASSFFFELDCLPRRNSEGYLMCTGQIRLRGDQKAILHSLQLMSHNRSLSPTSTFWLERQALGELNPLIDICSRCELFRKRVSFIVRNKEEKLKLSLRTHDFDGSISGFPQTMAWFIDRQDLDTFRQSSRYQGRAYCPCVRSASKSRKRRLDIVRLESRKRLLTVVSLEPQAQSWL